MNDVADIMSMIVLILFGLSLGETGWIIRSYFKIASKTRALLPSHVFMVGFATLLLELEVAFALVFNRFGSPITWYEPYNLVAFGLLWVSLITIRQHVTHKHTRQVQTNFKRNTQPEGEK